MGFLSRLFRQPTKAADQYIQLDGSGTFSTQVVGESHYQENLEKISGGHTEDGVELTTTAELIHADDNPYDKEAIRVQISGMPVGHLSRSDARHFRDRMRSDGYAGVIAKCAAKIRGGWNRGGGDIGHFGVTLDMPDEFVKSLSSNAQISDNLAQTIETDTFVFELDKVEAAELSQCRIGDPVNLWVRKDDPSKIYVFRRGSVGGTGRIGFIPSQYSQLIASHIDRGMKCETEIVGLGGRKCEIKYRLISKEETESRILQQAEALRHELTKKYSPTKPIELVLNVESDAMPRNGDKLGVVFDELDKYVRSPHEWQIRFVDQNGNTVGVKSDEKGVMQRILKAHFNSFLFDIEVLSTKEKHNWYANPIRLVLKPNKG